ncbi:hypothetical protein KAR91_77055 [Candidatus Pacearchaeota archaeon]|nr:hypothetical protein [Candidatus Pacearchaeota archaeon]
MMNGLIKGYNTESKSTVKYSDGRRNESLYCYKRDLNPALVKRVVGYRENTVELEVEDERSVGSIYSFENIKQESPVLRIKSDKILGTSITFSKWKGVVRNIEKESFIAKVTDIVEKIPDEEVEFFISDVSSDDKELLLVGAVFYWSIGHVFSSSGQITRASFLRFQRLPLFDRNSLNMAKRKAFDIQKNIRWE